MHTYDQILWWIWNSVWEHLIFGIIFFILINIAIVIRSFTVPKDLSWAWDSGLSLSTLWALLSTSQGKSNCVSERWNVFSRSGNWQFIGPRWKPEEPNPMALPFLPPSLSCSDYLVRAPLDVPALLCAPHSCLGLNGMSQVRWSGHTRTVAAHYKTITATEPVYKHSPQKNLNKPKSHPWFEEL